MLIERHSGVPVQLVAENLCQEIGRAVQDRRVVPEARRGVDVDLYLAVTLRDVIYIWRGDLLLAHAIEQGRLEAHGTARARRALPRWLRASALAHVQPQKAAARVA